MLVLARNINERLRIKVNGVIIWVSVMDIRKSGVRIGIEAPQEAEILREEVVLQQENPSAIAAWRSKSAIRKFKSS